MATEASTEFFVGDVTILVVKSYSNLFTKFGVFLKCAICPITLSMLSYSAVPLALLIYFDGLDENIDNSLFLFPVIFFLTSFALVWHRAIYFNTYNPAKILWIDVSSKFPKFLGMVGLFAGAFISYVYVTGLLISHIDGLFAQFFTGAIGYILLMYATARFSLCFPAIAIGRKMGFGESWKLTSTIPIKIFWIYFWVFLPPQIGIRLNAKFATESETILEYVLQDFLTIMLIFIHWAVVASAASLILQKLDSTIEEEQPTSTVTSSPST